MADCLSTALILREIFQNFSSTQLLELSLVNKQWNHEARNLMRKRGDVTAGINKNSTCQYLRAFASDFQRMTDVKKVIPFSGITIALGRYKSDHMDSCEESSSAGELDDFSEVLLDQMAWKNLTVRMDWNWHKFENCPVLLLLMKIFQKYDYTLEELSLQLVNKQEFLQAVLKDCSFPSLKYLRLKRWGKSRMPLGLFEEDTILIKTLVSLAPNLQVLYTEECVNLQANLLEGSSAVHVTDYEYSPSCSSDLIPESVAGQLRMQRIRLDWIDLEFNIAKFNRITATLLQNSRKTLRWMKIFPIFLVPLMRYGISLENVWKLCLMFTDDGQEFRHPLLWRIVKSFDFARLFPNLSTLHISWMFVHNFRRLSSVFNDMIEQENLALIEPVTLDRAKSIKSLRLLWDRRIRDSFTQFLAQMVPYVQKLYIRSTDIPFTGIWESWQDLNEFDVIIDIYITRQNLDSAFCGIFPQEVAQLQEKDEEYLRRVNIVPVMPSITCLKGAGLKTLNMSFKDHNPSNVGRIDDGTRVLSKVTGLIAFERLPALTVNLKTYDERTKEVLNDLKPYASVVLEEVIAAD